MTTAISGVLIERPELLADENRIEFAILEDGTHRQIICRSSHHYFLSGALHQPLESGEHVKLDGIFVSDAQDQIFAFDRCKVTESVAA